ncbi:glycosyltransferase involved in cell wall biosynthesis [Shewanella chilikensis]|uniref:Glycosyltransferase involved in cell wall biosynthesis n=1 Tax=Shewanella chilikensis TaxID=558541 RepID=A0ABX5PM01_9GAMM|nr:glycosyltransferase family 2 protein [Shewanella chilikensis]MCL1152653.1 glycosyltransferase family 2 protein [Shewanella chilikensis]PYE57638.1 glycosyltransferase involved in cell wall biosynthesis [Shewanella chilikensis]GGZ40827.1 glycosyl transferase [Shewanella chilikensis]
MNICCFVLTLNEGKNVTTCIQSLRSIFDTKDVYILDSGSVDNTVEQVEKQGITVLTNVQVGTYSAAEQRNYALNYARDNGYDWVLFIDADEYLSDSFVNASLKKIDEYRTFDVISIPMLYRLHGKNIRSMGYPNWHDRIVRTNQSFKANVGEYIESKSRAYANELEIVHNFNSLGMRRFIEKQSRYAEYIGKQIYDYSQGNASDYFFKPGIKGYLKKVFSRMGLFRPFIRFIYQYIFRLGFIEGRSGFIAAVYMFIFEFLVAVSVIEYKREKSNLVL